MSAPATPPPPAAPAAKGPKTLLWILLGAAGCLLAIAVTLLVIGIVSGLAFRRRIADQQRMVTSMNVHMEEDQLTLYLDSDPDRADKVRKVWDELRKQADAGELKEGEAQHLSDEVRKITSDGQVSSDEADEAIAMGAKIAGIEP